MTTVLRGQDQSQSEAALDRCGAVLAKCFGLPVVVPVKEQRKNHMFAVLDKCGVLTLNVQAGHCCRQFGHKDHGYTRAQAIDVCKHFHTQQSCRVRLL